MLQSFEHERAKEKANDLGGSFLRAVRNVAKQEDRSQEIERDWAKDWGSFRKVAIVAAQGLRATMPAFSVDAYNIHSR